MARVLLIRHTQVALRWSERCYGRSDVGLSREGKRVACQLANTLANESITALIHSGLKRAAFLADRLAQLKQLEPAIDARWRERDFGAWEGRAWHAIWRETGNAMDGMLSRPHDFRPGGGETTAELATRSLAALHALPRAGLVVVVTHGGPIAAVRAMLAGAQMSEMARYRVAEGVAVPLRVPRDFAGL